MKFSIVPTTVNMVAFGRLLVSGGSGGGILPPALATLPPLSRDTKLNNDDVGPTEVLEIMSSGGAASTSEYCFLGSEEPKDEVRISL